MGRTQDRRNPPTVEATEMDYARLAAYIDGEGSILLNKFARTKARPGGGQPWDIWLRVTIINTDPRVLIWAKERFGGRVSVHNPGPSKRVNDKNSFTWLVSCGQAAEIISRALPYFIIKKEQAEIAMAFAKTKGTCGKWLPESIRDERLALREQLAQLRAKDWPKDSIQKEYSELVN